MNTYSNSTSSGGRPAGRSLTLHRWCILLLVLAASLITSATGLYAEEAKEAKEGEEAKDKKETKKPLTPEQMFEGGETNYANWVELSAGAMFTSGNTAQAQENHRLAEGPFGGIEDLHYQNEVSKGNFFTVDGRALFDLDDYKLNLSLVNEKKGFVRIRYQQFRTWYNGDGGFYQPAQLWFPLSNDELSIERGEFSFQAGLTLKNRPQVTFEYAHQFRDGKKSSTIWGPANLGFYDPNFSGTRMVVPSFYEIDEQRDIFKLDVTHHIKKTDFGGGVRYEIGEIDNRRQMLLRPGEPTERRITDREGSSNDSISAHAFSETWFKNNLMFSSGLLYTRFNSDFSGSRIYGDDFDVGYVPNAANGVGYTDLDGIMHRNEYVMNLNLMAMPAKAFTIVPSMRVQKRDWNSEFEATQTSAAAAPVPAAGDADGDSLDVQERLDLRYTGITNWVLFTRGEWNQGQGTLNENGGVGLTAPIQRESDDTRWFQKYSLGARWYPTRNMTLDFGGYYKNNHYDYDHDVDSTPNDPASGNRYPAFLVMQDFETLDGNLRLTLRPVRNVTLVTRYEYQLSTIHTKPDSVSGLGDVESSEMNTHIIGQNISWVPLSRLSLQLGANYVFSETRTPTSDFTQAILDSQNNYWTLNFNTTVVLNNKTDLNLGYFFYQSDNYQNNSLAGLPLGAEATEHGITALLTRRLSVRTRLNLRYAFFHYEDTPSGGHNDYDAHTILSTIQYRF